MRAAVHAGAGEIRLETRATPAIGAGELLLRVRGCGLCGSDLAKFRGPARHPAVLGHEVVGEVAAVGEGAGDLRPGERVVVAHHVPCARCHYCLRGSVSMCRAFKASNLDPGGFSEYVRVPAENVRHVTFRVPAGMPDAVASFTEPLGCGVRAIRRAAITAGDTVAVAGLGAMGCLLVQLARLRGARVVAVDPIPARRALAKSLGAEIAVAPEAAGATLAGVSDGRGADVVVLTAGAPALVRAALGWSRDGGAVHLFVGEGEGPLPIGEIYRRELTLTATYSSSPADLAEAFDLIRSGAVRVAELCSHRLPLERLAEAVDLMERREALKVFVEVGHRPKAVRSATAEPPQAEGRPDGGPVRAQVFYGPGDLRFEDLPIPEPGPGEVVLRIEAALTCGTDVKTLRRGHPVMIPRVPTIFGHEFTGTVTAVGAGVGGVRPGDRAVAANSAPCGACAACRRGQANLCDDLLFVNGAYAEYIALPPRLVTRNLVTVPQGTDAARAAFAEPVACCLRAIDAAAFGAGDTVAVLGHGPLGLLLGLLARAGGARVVLAGKAGPRFDRAAGLGFTACVDVARVPDPVSAVRDAAGGDVRCVIEATGRPEVWTQAIAVAGKGGTVVFFGGCAPGTTVPLDTRRVHYEELRLLGVFHHTPGLIRRAVALLADGTLDPTALVTHEMGLGDVPRALDLMSRGEALKVLIRP